MPLGYTMGGAFDLPTQPASWGKPERAPHEHEVWCWDATFIYIVRPLPGVGTIFDPR